MRRLLACVGIGAAAAAAWMLMLPAAPLVQPLVFDHAKHGGMACKVCHRGAETSARASIPQGETCLECHAGAPAGVEPALWDEVARGGRLAWVRATRVRDDVYFSHRRHVSIAKLDCSSCHADVGQRHTPPGRAPVRLDMDGCLGCHRSEGASQDCAGCHR